MSADIDETPVPGEAPEDYVLRMAVEKAAAVKVSEGAVIGSDTVVVLSGNVLQKPVSAEDARRMLCSLSGQNHLVMTAVAIRVNRELRTTVSTTKVTFAALEKSLIDTYLTTDEPWDKAGAYGIQGLAGSFVSSIEGSYSSVVGLPLYETRELLAAAGINTKLSDAGA